MAYLAPLVWHPNWYHECKEASCHSPSSFSAMTPFRGRSPTGLLLFYVVKAISGVESLFRDAKKSRSFRSSRVADAHVTAHDVPQLLTTLHSRRRRIRDASLATAWAASRRTIGHKSQTLAADAAFRLRER
eukprot:357217-Chlamydomonas_euryale.AAC.6